MIFYQTCFYIPIHRLILKLWQHIVLNRVCQIMTYSDFSISRHATTRLVTQISFCQILQNINQQFFVVVVIPDTACYFSKTIHLNMVQQLSQFSLVKAEIIQNVINISCIQKCNQEFSTERLTDEDFSIGALGKGFFFIVVGT